MKSAILSLLGLKLTSETSLHFSAEPNASFDLISDYMSKVYQCAASSHMASLFITTALDHGFKNLLEGEFSRNETFITHLKYSESDNRDHFNVTLSVPCFKSGDYFDFLTNEISPDTKQIVSDSFCLEVVFDVALNLDDRSYKINTQSLALKNINKLHSCLLDDALAYVYEPRNDIVALHRKLDDCIDLFDIFSLIHFQHAKVVYSRSA